jgi:hypothetical protein
MKSQQLNSHLNFSRLVLCHLVSEDVFNHVLFPFLYVKCHTCGQCVDETCLEYQVKHNLNYRLCSQCLVHCKEYNCVWKGDVKEFSDEGLCQNHSWRKEQRAKRRNRSVYWDDYDFADVFSMIGTCALCRERTEFQLFGEKGFWFLCFKCESTLTEKHQFVCLGCYEVKGSVRKVAKKRQICKECVSREAMKMHEKDLCVYREKDPLQSFVNQMSFVGGLGLGVAVSKGVQTLKRKWTGK